MANATEIAAQREFQDPFALSKAAPAFPSKKLLTSSGLWVMAVAILRERADQ